jgi:hypothetical protein
MRNQLNLVALCALCAFAAPAHGAEEAGPRAIGWFGARAALVAAFDAMPTPRLQAMFLQCARESSERAFGMDEAVPCAMAWDTLLQREFGGDVRALLAWWRGQRAASE